MRKPRTRKQVKIIEAIGSVLGVLAFAALVIPAIFSDEQGHYEDGWIFIVVFFLLGSAALAILLSVMSDSLAVEIEKQSKFSLSVLSNVGRPNVLRIFRENGFENAFGGLYKKKTFNLLKGTLYYYLAFADYADAESLDSSYASFVQHLEVLSEEEDAYNKYFTSTILFLYKDEVTEEDKQALRELAADVIVTAANFATQDNVYVLPVLVDSSTGQGFYMTKEKGLSTYAYGCRLLKKLLK